MLLAALAPATAEARNRTIEMLRSTLGGDGRFSKAELDRVRHYHGPDDQPMLGSAIIGSWGFVSTRVGGQGHELAMLRLYNESAVPICVRVRGGWVSGPFMQAQQVNNTGINMLLRPRGGSESVLNASLRRAISNPGRTNLGAYFWAADMAAGEGRRCSSVAPPDLDAWLNSPPPTDRPDTLATPDLALKLGLVPAVAPGPAALPSVVPPQRTVDSSGGSPGRLHDEQQALRGFESAAAAGQTDAMFQLGEYHREGRAGLQPNDARAADWYRRAAQLGNAHAASMLGEFLATGRGGLPRNRAEAESWFDTAQRLQGPALASVSRAANQLLERAPVEAIGWYAYGIEAAARLSAESFGARHGDSMFESAYIQVLKAPDLALPMPYDERLIRGLKATLARDGAKVDPRVLTLLGILHLEGRGGSPRDDLQTARWLASAAQRGDPDGAFVLALSFQRGTLGGRPEPAAAMNLYRQAAQGWHRAQLQAPMAMHLGALYASAAAGPSSNLAVARVWLQRASASVPQAATLMAQLDAQAPMQTASCAFSGRYQARSAGNGATEGPLNYRATLLGTGDHMALVLEPSGGSSVVLDLRQMDAVLQGEENVLLQDGSRRSYIGIIDGRSGRHLVSASMADRPPGDPSAQYRYSAAGVCGPLARLR